MQLQPVPQQSVALLIKSLEDIRQSIVLATEYAVLITLESRFRAIVQKAQRSDPTEQNTVQAVIEGVRDSITEQYVNLVLRHFEAATCYFVRLSEAHIHDPIAQQSILVGSMVINAILGRIGGHYLVTTEQLSKLKNALSAAEKALKPVRYLFQNPELLLSNVAHLLPHDSNLLSLH